MILYDLTKRLQEEMASDFSETYGLPVTILRAGHIVDGRLGDVQLRTESPIVLINRTRRGERPSAENHRSSVSVQHMLGECRSAQQVPISIGRMYHLGIRLPANQIFQYLADHAHPWVTFSFKF